MVRYTFCIGYNINIIYNIMKIKNNSLVILIYCKYFYVILQFNILYSTYLPLLILTCVLFFLGPFVLQVVLHRRLMHFVLQPILIVPSAVVT